MPHPVPRSRAAVRDSRPVAVLFAVVALLAAGADRVDVTAVAVDRIDGEWRLVALEQHQDSIDREELRQLDIRVLFERETMTIIQGGEPPTDYPLLTHDAERRPGRFEWCDEFGGLNRAVYRVRHDTVEICVSESDGPFPECFATQDDASRSLLVLERVGRDDPLRAVGE